MDLVGWLRKQLAEADTDLLREMVRSFAEALMGAEADAICGAPYGVTSCEQPEPLRNAGRAAFCLPE
jgi:transposase-like protein